MVIHIFIVLIPIVLFLGALFAATEASLFSLSQTQLEALKTTKPSTYRAIQSLIRKPEELLSTIVVGNEALSILVGTFVVTLIEFYFSQWSETATAITALITSTFLLLLFSEILPKVIAYRLPVITASVLVHPASWAHIFLTPFRKLLQSIAKKILSLFRFNVSPQAALTEKEFLTLVEVGAETGSLERQESEMIYNVFHLSDRPISSVMTSWERVFHLKSNQSLESVLEKIRSRPLSRIPVVSSKDGHLVGILYTKELISILADNPEEKTKEEKEEALGRAIFPPYYVSTHKKVSRLFREMRNKKIHMAVVVDEYGRHLGLVTLEDILNTLFKSSKKTQEGNK